MSNGTAWFFGIANDKDGYLKSVADHTGRTYTYEVEGGRLNRAVRPDGGAFVYECKGNGKLSGGFDKRILEVHLWEVLQ